MNTFKDPWILNGIIAISLSGLFSLVIALMRIARLDILPDNIFDLSLVIHVNLAVMAWNLSIIHSWGKQSFFSVYASRIMLVAIVGMVLSILVPNSAIIKSNYVPVIDNLAFFVSLALLGASTTIASVSQIIINRKSHTFANSTIIILSLINVIAAYHTVEASTKDEFYEFLFWGGGHILQFAFTGAMLVAYSKISGIKISGWVYLINLGLVAFTPAFYLLDKGQIANAFTLHMKWFGGVVPALAFIDLTLRKKLLGIITQPINACSIFLFIYGAILGFNISGHNTTIPAHYHGSIVAVSVAIMGYVYSKTYIRSKFKNIQMILYTLGQTLHITGLAWMGGYGALRKTSIASAQLPVATTIAKVMFIAGGMITLVSGIAFIVMLIAEKKPSAT